MICHSKQPKESNSGYCYQLKKPENKENNQNREDNCVTPKG